MKVSPGHVLLAVTALAAGISFVLLHRHPSCGLAAEATREQEDDVSAVLALLDPQWAHVDPAPEVVAARIGKLLDLEKKASEPQPADAVSTGAAIAQALAVAGMQCNIARNNEYWGDPVIWGDSHRTNSEGECCAACHAHRARAAQGGLATGANSTTCDTWVWCGDKERCGAHYQECWLKHQKALPPADVPPATASAMWTSGVVYDEADFAQAYDKYTKLVMHTKVGDIVVTLLPNIAPDVVRELKREVVIIQARGGGCTGCRFYRAEDFGIQGQILSPGAYIGSPNFVPPAPMKKIPPGYVCRAGAGGSVHFFINWFDTDWGEAMCWGKVDDLTLSKEISHRPLRKKLKPTELSMLEEELYFNMTLLV
ncbi:hypothetical protein HYH03_007528 [Edaphochlamys debaryana]|uniref:Uncharacterized protein n=1 Tax=Edaphochlamys debaryana TaxID=47281 RepID=A0A835Y211_9CHLO|nr:hypothetical protein HYH03_007528 [Edaphochlamys debaryana]|eukprot:KAG2494476.1 hypothetical protein HYH03_007528 [Edaphochlamys debaryana]